MKYKITKRVLTWFLFSFVCLVHPIHLQIYNKYKENLSDLLYDTLLAIAYTSVFILLEIKEYKHKTKEYDDQ